MTLLIIMLDQGLLLTCKHHSLQVLQVYIPVAAPLPLVEYLLGAMESSTFTMGL